MASKRVGKIYKITVNKDFYIGSTWHLKKRAICHKRFSKFKNSKLYKAIRDNNNEFEMTLLYDYECYTDTELRMEERKCYDELKPNLNMQRPYTTQEENIEQAKQNKRQYYQKNRETILEREKQSRIENKEKFLEKAKKSYIKYREKQLKQTKERRDKNKYICGCGNSVLNVNSAIKKHEQCKKHRKYLLEI